MLEDTVRAWCSRKYWDTIQQRVKRKEMDEATELPCYDPTRIFGERQTENQSRVWVVILAHCEGLEVSILLITRTNVLTDEAAPEFTLLEGSHVETSNNSEVVRATFQGSEQVHICGSIRIHDLA